MRIPEVKHAITIAVFLSLTASATGQSARTFKYHFNEGSGQSRVVSENNSVNITYSISELNLSEIPVDNELFYRIAIPGHVNSVSAGRPEMPVFSGIIVVPEGSEYKISIKNVKSTRVKPAAKSSARRLYPAQEGLTKTNYQEKRKFHIDSKLYETRGFIESDTVRIEELGMVRNQRLANIYISPVRYNPHSNILEVINSMNVTITFSKSSGESQSVPQLLPMTEQLNKGLLNYSPDDVVPGYTDQPVKMIILTDTTFRKHLEPLIRWKTQKGFKVSVLYRGDKYAGTTYTQLRDTLSGIYKSAKPDNPPPEYLLLVGDVNKIPYYGNGNGNITDLYYGEYDGDGDYIPEVYIGRLPVADTTELKNVVNKIIQYEKFEFNESNKFYSKALSFAGEDQAYASTMNGQVKYAVSNYYTTANSIKDHHFYYPHASLSGTKDSVLKLINSGISFINYTGHGDASGLLDINIKTVDISSLTNENMYPFFISNACLTAQFNLANSFGNRMVISDKKGSIGFIGCSNDSYWDEDYYWAVGVGAITQDPTYAGTKLGALDRLFHTHGEKASDWYYTMGQVNFAGNMSVSASTSKWKKYYWETYNLIGDPSLIPIIGTPKKFSVTIPDTLPNGIKAYSINLEPFAYAAVSRSDTLWDAAFAGPSGTVQLDLPGVSNSSCTLVITGQNKIPIIKTLYFRKLATEYINLSKTYVNDPDGNNNGRADFGETFYFGLKLSNLGWTAANNLYAKISTTSEWAVIESDSVYIGTLAGGDEIDLSDKLRLRVRNDVTDLGLVSITLNIKDSYAEHKYIIDVPVHAPELQLMNCIIDDQLFGNGDMVADPGEKFELVFKVANNGTSSASGQFSVTSLLPNLTIIEPSVKSGDLKYGEISEIRVQVNLSESTPSGGVFSVSSSLNCEPYQIAKDFSFRAGKIRESFETDNFSVFPWMNASKVPWILTDKLAYDGMLSARSGAISNGGLTTLSIRTIYEKADSIRFYYKVSSEPVYDYLSFKLNKTELLKKSGETGWTRKAVAVQPGVNLFEWSYKKDVSVFQGSDCAWIDLIDFAGSGSVKYIAKDLNVSGMESPLEKEKYGKEEISVRVKNLGNNHVNGFNLAYSINNGAPVKQKFTDTIPFNDSVTVKFTARADFSKYGKYDLRVFSTDNGDDYLQNDTLRAEINNVRLEEGLSVYPNPFVDEFTLYLNLTTSGKVEIYMTNVNGTKVYSTKRDLISGINSLVLNDFNLAPGTYYLTIRGSSITQTIPVIKLK